MKARDEPGPRRRLSAWRRLGWRPPILMYHRIGEEEADPLLRRFTVTPRRFAAQMQALARLRFHVVPLERILEWLVEGRPLPPRPVALTFDDGYEETYRVAAPLLERHGFPATLFLVADHVGRRSTWDSDVAPEGKGFPLISWAQARELSRRGFGIGSHSRTHPELPSLDDEALAAELRGSREILEEGLEAPVIHLAYPYNLADERCREAARAAGYEGACGGEAAPYDRWCLDRVNTSRASLPLFLAKVSPWFWLYRRARRQVEAWGPDPWKYGDIEAWG